VTKGATAKTGQAKREALVLAAAELFWMRGFEASSLADIAEASGVPLGNVYYYFKTKAISPRRWPIFSSSRPKR
jgi:AcrR family transcriptional regulator